MSFILLLEQIFNGLQFGVTLFLIAAGLTLILGIMDFVFLAHGAQVMIGAYAAASLTALTGNFYGGILLAIPITFASGYLLEYLLIRHLYRRNHMDQVLATFGLILFFNELIRVGFGPAALFSSLPPSRSVAAIAEHRHPHALCGACTFPCLHTSKLAVAKRV